MATPTETILPRGPASKRPRLSDADSIADLLGDEEDEEEILESSTKRDDDARGSGNNSWKVWETKRLIHAMMAYKKWFPEFYVRKGACRSNKKQEAVAPDRSIRSKTQLLRSVYVMLSKSSHPDESPENAARKFDRSYKSVERRVKDLIVAYNDWAAMKSMISGQDPKTVGIDDPAEWVHPEIQRFREKHKNWLLDVDFVDDIEEIFDGKVIYDLSKIQDTSSSATILSIDAMSRRISELGDDDDFDDARLFGRHEVLQST